MRIKLTTVFVDNQDSALKFYTDILGFEKKQDFPVGQFKWLTVVSPEEPEGPDLLLEPSDNAAARSYKESIYEQGDRRRGLWPRDDIGSRPFEMRNYFHGRSQ